jgi:hypothetical protein
MGILGMVADAETLLAERAEVVKRLAPLRALYGGNGYGGERQIKLVEARVSAAVRATLAAQGGKITEGMIDEATRQHPEYIQALTDDLTQRQRWIEYEEELAEIEWRLRCRSSDASLLAAEARLTPVAM